MDTGQEEKDQQPETNWKQELWEWGKAIGIAIIAALILTQVIFVNASIPSGSMENTIMTGDRVLGFRWSYFSSVPQRGDVVMFYFPDDEREIYVKRVIGLPGETIQIIGGKVYVNEQEQPLEEPYIKGVPSGDFGPYSVPEGSYFMLGDNRLHSWDSRKWDNTFVKIDKIIGKAFVRLFPNPGLLE